MPSAVPSRPRKVRRVTAILFTLAAMSGGLIRVVLRDRFGRLATTVANLFGSFLLGVIVAGGFEDTLTVVLGTGFCGSLTTMSGLVIDACNGPRSTRHLHLVRDIFTGIAAVTLGFLFNRILLLL